MNTNHYTFRTTCSPEDGEHVGLCAEFPLLSWLAPNQEQALDGIRRLVADVVDDMQDKGERLPDIQHPQPIDITHANHRPTH